MPYTMINVGKGTGGMFANTVPKVPTHWLAYVGVEDIAATQGPLVRCHCVARRDGEATTAGF